MPTNVTIPTLDGEGAIPAYRAAPTGAPRAAIIVIPEIFGVNQGIKAKCDDWAELGYLATAPDIFWRFAPGSELDPEVEEEFQQAIANMTKCDLDLVVTDIEAIARYCRDTEGVMIDQMLGEAHAITNPLMLHIPTADHFVGPDAQRAMHEGLDPNPKVTLHDYPGLDHGFASSSGSRRNEEGAQLADQRTRDFFAAHLG